MLFHCIAIAHFVYPFACWFVSPFGLTWLMLLLAFTYQFLCKWIVSVFLGMFIGVKLWDWESFTFYIYFCISRFHFIVIQHIIRYIHVNKRISLSCSDCFMKILSKFCSSIHLPVAIAIQFISLKCCHSHFLLLPTIDLM